MSGLMEINGVLQRSNDMSIMRHQDENKAFVDNAAALNTVDKNAKQKQEEVNATNESDLLEYRYDAKDESKGGANSNSNGKKKKKDEPEDKVVPKKTGGFDIKI